jgi:signal peptidase II
VQEHGVEPPVATGQARPRWGAIGLTALAVIVVDQLTKWWAVNTLDTRTIDLFWSLRLRLAFNTGTAFSIGSRFSSIIALIAVAVVLVLLRASRSMRAGVATIAVGLVVGGALGNLADRVLREGGGFLGGAVVDFVDLQWWPIFNVADAAICVGAVLLALTASRE